MLLARCSDGVPVHAVDPRVDGPLLRSLLVVGLHARVDPHVGGAQPEVLAQDPADAIDNLRAGVRFIRVKGYSVNFCYSNIDDLRAAVREC